VAAVGTAATSVAGSVAGPVDSLAFGSVDGGGAALPPGLSVRGANARAAVEPPFRRPTKNKGRPPTVTHQTTPAARATVSKRITMASTVTSVDGRSALFFPKTLPNGRWFPVSVGPALEPRSRAPWVPYHSPRRDHS
jgi:hypothetical protein